MTVYTSRIENCWSFFNFSFCFRDFNEVLLHEKYTKIIDKNRPKMDCLQSCFSRIFSMKASPYLFCIWKPLKWAFQNWSYMPLCCSCGALMDATIEYGICIESLCKRHLSRGTEFVIFISSVECTGCLKKSVSMFVLCFSLFIKL